MLFMNMNSVSMYIELACCCRILLLYSCSTSTTAVLAPRIIPLAFSCFGKHGIWYAKLPYQTIETNRIMAAVYQVYLLEVTGASRRDDSYCPVELAGCGNA